MSTMMRVMRARAFAVTSSSTASRGTARGVTARRGRGRAVASRATRDGEGVSDLAAMDAVIDLMLEAKSEEEVGKIVVENVLMFDQKMWMRFASRSDTAEGSAEKTRIMELAGACMKLVEAMVEKTENTMEEALARMKTALESVMVDERTLNTLYAWIRKSDENGLDGMVHILQRLLQLYAARELDENSSALDTVIRSNAEEWQMHFIDISKEGYNETAFTKDLQRRMEGVVLNLPNGSYAQRVQAEYLKEIEDRGKEFFAQQA
jgi:hypothetical protein